MFLTFLLTINIVVLSATANTETTVGAHKAGVVASEPQAMSSVTTPYPCMQDWPKTVSKKYLFPQHGVLHCSSIFKVDC